MNVAAALIISGIICLAEKKQKKKLFDVENRTKCEP